MPREKPPRRWSYDTDMSDGQWAPIEPLIPQAEPGGQPRKAAARELVNKRYPFVERACADGGYAGRFVEWAKTKTHIVLEIVRRNATT